jgi:Cys-tRNA(Pro)/Cys-tRNA(Cys) deacylase
MISNNVTRLLQARKILFTSFELPPEKLGALETAVLLHIPPLQVFKTIVVVREKPGKPILAIIPGPHEVDLKALAQFVGDKKLKIPTQKEAEQLTGLQAGGISPLALINRGFQMVLDQTALDFDEIHISGGQRGLNIRLPVKDLLQLINARTALVSTLQDQI